MELNPEQQDEQKIRTAFLMLVAQRDQLGRDVEAYARAATEIETWIDAGGDISTTEAKKVAPHLGDAVTALRAISRSSFSVLGAADRAFGTATLKERAN